MYQQRNPPLSPKKILPTMYDLPSEEVEDSGLPDQYHLWQGELLEKTFKPSDYSPEQVFVAMDLNLYYDLRHTHWYKRPDWFAVLGVDRLYEQRESRLSYVMWQEGIAPFIVIELLSASTEKEDLGQTLRAIDKPPTKWEVYEKIVRIPYYIVFNGKTNQLRLFELIRNSYREIDLQEPKFWLPEIKLGLALWEGTYQGYHRLWLRWYDQDNNWIPTPVEKKQQLVEQEKQRADKAELEIQRLKELLRQAGLEIPE